MIIDSKASDLLKQYEEANEEESVAIKKLHSYIQKPIQDDDVVKNLFQNMELAHNKKMGLWNKLQAFRLDK